MCTLNAYMYVHKLNLKGICNIIILENLYIRSYVGSYIYCNNNLPDTYRFIENLYFCICSLSHSEGENVSLMPSCHKRRYVYNNFSISHNFNLLEVAINIYIATVCNYACMYIRIYVYY